MTVEMGGFIPLEIQYIQNEYYSAYENDMVRVNSGRTGILYALKCINPAKVYVPYYNCPDVIRLIKEYCGSVQMYMLDEQFLPRIENADRDSCILYTNYFGLIDETNIIRLLERHRNVIVDNTQAFFSKPVMDAYTVYSCRKVFGVPDGGYIIHKEIERLDFPRGLSYDRCTFLLKGIELGNDASYKDYLVNEERLCNEHTMMSSLTKILLQTQDYPRAIKKRCDNYDELDRRLGKKNGVRFTREDKVPYIYPFYFEQEGLRDHLKKRHIYVPKWWNHVLQVLPPETLECRLAKYLLPLPIDQRYGIENMQYLSSVIEEIIE